MAPVSSVRRPSVDMLRGAVMIIMALDHVREYFTNLSFPPEDVSQTWGALFFMRFITHFCAPAFFLLAGTGAFLSGSQDKPIAQVSRFLWTRGLWLIILEPTLVGFGWTFEFPFPFASILWALGWSMVTLALLVRLPIRWIFAIGVVMVAGHNLFDGIEPAKFGRFYWLFEILHRQGMVFLHKPDAGFFVLYPLIPWIGVMALGYVLGAVLQRDDRVRILLITGAIMLAAFLGLRGFNLYGNGTAGMGFSAGGWSPQSRWTLSVVSFFDTQKYPPSLDYLLMTLGPALIALAGFEKIGGQSRWARVLNVYGRVPMFYYILHIYLLHLASIIVSLIFGQSSEWLWHGAVWTGQRPPGYGHGLGFIYLIWALIVVALYLPCKWFMNFKREHREWRWLGYV